MHENATNDRDLALIVQLWSAMPAAVRAAIVAMVKAVGGGPSQQTGE